MTKTAENPEKQGVIGKFFDLLGNKSQSTKNGYTTAIWSFFKFKLNLTDAQKADLDQYATAYFEGNPDVVKDFRRFMQTETFQKKAPLGAKQVFLQLTMFFALTGHEIAKKDIKALENQLPRGGKASEEAYLDKEMLNQMLQHCDVRKKAIIEVLASSGMRIGELVSIRCEDVHLPTEQVPVTWLYLRKTKNGRNRHTHISTEATAAVREWIKIRPSYLQSNSERGLALMSKKQKEAGLSKNAKTTEDDRLFPMSENTVRELVAELVTKVSGENAKCGVTGRSLLHPHSFRKYFETQLTDAKMVSGVVKALAGQVTELEKIYVNMTPAQTAKHYITAEHALWIEGTPEQREAATNNSKKFEAINEAQQTSQNLINKLSLESMNLKDKLREQEATHSAQMAKMMEMVQAMEKRQSALYQKYIELRGEPAPAAQTEPFPEA